MTGAREVLYELHRVGSAVRVTAVDPVTGTEITMIGDPRVGEAALKRLARQKLDYVLAKQRGER
jgi:hypothetical protein